jgi:ribosomal protein S18 acetylase RimI-like enzyme
VAEEEGVINGFALYYIRYSTWKGQRMYLEDILVTENARGRGLGKLLMDALIAEAKERNFHGITWQVLEWNEPAMNFYRKYKANFDPEWVNASIKTPNASR